MESRLNIPAPPKATAIGLTKGEQHADNWKRPLTLWGRLIGKSVSIIPGSEQGESSEEPMVLEALPRNKL